MTRHASRKGEVVYFLGTTMKTRRRDSWRSLAWLLRSSARGRTQILSVLAGLALQERQAAQAIHTWRHAAVGLQQRGHDLLG